MMLGKNFKDFIVKMIPDDAVVIIDGNYEVDIEEISVEFSDDVVADLILTKGFSVTCDRIMDSLFNDLRILKG